MVTVLPKRDEWGDAFRQLGKEFTSSAGESYMNRSDENSIQESLSRLPEKASARDILNAVTGARTYGQQAKQQAFQNYLGFEQFEELKKKNQIAQEREKLEQDRKSLGAIELVKNSELPAETKEKLSVQLENNEIDPGVIKELTKPPAKPTVAEEKHAQQQKEIKEGLQTLDRMIEIGDKGNLGRGSNYLRYLSNTVAEDYGEYERLGKSLIQLSTNIPIRNRQEFETLAHDLYDPSIADAQRKGILNALKFMLENRIKEDSGQNPDKKVSTTVPERKPLSAFRR
jgi:hypothetical protein